MQRKLGNIADKSEKRFFCIFLLTIPIYSNIMAMFNKERAILLRADTAMSCCSSQACAKQQRDSESRVLSRRRSVREDTFSRDTLPQYLLAPRKTEKAIATT